MLRSASVTSKGRQIQRLTTSQQRLEDELTQANAEVDTLRHENLRQDARVNSVRALCSDLTSRLSDANVVRAANNELTAQLGTVSDELRVAKEHSPGLQL